MLSKALSVGYIRFPAVFVGNLAGMKRRSLHLVFWVLYLFQDVLLLYSLNHSRWRQAPDRALLLGIENGLVLLLPKLAFTYYIFYRTLPRLSEKGKALKSSVSSILALAGALLLYRVLVFYVVDPMIYGWQPEPPTFFYLLGFLVALMDLGFASGSAIAIKLVRLQLHRQAFEKDLLREKLETELKYLRNQTNPHFLFNTLNNIYALARKKSDQTPDAIMKLSELLRFMLYETAKPQITIGEEVRMLQDYMELEQLRYNGRLTVTFSRSLEDEGEAIAPLLLLPFVENAFKHGAGESRFASAIQIDMKVAEGKLYFDIENTKENRQPTETEASIGLRNVKRQLELMYGDYSLQVENKEERFRVSLYINLKSYAHT